MSKFDVISQFLERIAIAEEMKATHLGTIAESIEKLVELRGKQMQETDEFAELIEAETNSLEMEFFQRVIKVYYEEEQLVMQRGGGKKSSIRVSNNLSETYVDFFSEKLPDLNIEVEKGGLLVFWKNGTPLCALKVYTDLGYGSRGERWYSNIDHFKQEAISHGVSADNVYFLVISFRNGLDNEHVQSLLGLNISNKELLDPKNRDHLEKFVKEYFKCAKGYIPNPDRQLFCLAGGLHPNVLDEAVTVDLTTYDWLRPTVTELIRQIRSL